MSAPRGLTAEECAAWEQLAATVTPLHPRRPARPAAVAAEPAPARPAAKHPTKSLASKPKQPPPESVLPKPFPPAPGLDSHWDRRLKAGALQPELTLDLHGHTLDTAYDRLMSGIAQARAMGVRTVLLVTGKPRPGAAADRAGQRGAIRAKLLDWLAASSHHSAIVAIRRAHQRHGGDGALYIVLRRER